MQVIPRGLSISIVVAAIIVTACGQASPALTEQPATTLASAPGNSPTNPPATGAIPLPTKALTAEALPPEPQDVEFQADDGQSLQGRYYPAAMNPAPLVVLMHWAPGDQNEWNAIAPWLQNRGQAGGINGKSPWLDSSWFPPMPEGQSLAVFTFTFRNCEGGCKSFRRDAWLLDAQAAMRKVRQLEGIDPSRIVAVGASIGADGAADGCGWLNSQFPNSCLGALSLSPGSYLTLPYQDAVSTLGAEQPPRPAWCLYAEGDTESARACEGASGDNYRAVKYAGNHHGMMLIQPNGEPSALEMILDFLKLTLNL